MTTRQLAVDALTARVGVEVLGVDLSGPLPRDLIADIRAILLESSVVAFRGQNLSSDQLLAFAQQFGELAEAWPVVLGETGETPQVARFDSSVGGTKDSTAQWHSDISYIEDPPSISFLHGVAIPTSGGDTLFASAEVAYSTLSVPLQQLCDPLFALHDSRGWGHHLSDHLAKTGVGSWNGRTITNLDPVQHPLVRIHPETGRKSLFVEPAATTRIVGLAPHESAQLLQLLQDHVTRPEHVLRYRWKAGDIVMWDQRNTWHRAVADYGDEQRIVQRISLRGDRPTCP